MNYQVASSINPKVSFSLNPKISSSINPNISSNIKGLYVFDLQLSPVGFTVHANERVDLLFSPSCDFQGVLVQVRDDFRNEFDLSNEWVGYWLHARDNVWLRFDLANQWVGFTT